ncbi:hypothetical protein SDC9_202025 [bioreactor metagenome]|uniref:Uncharacterized protein n=1 Tax=bioreactor metagenome TaxID=1076179 RepID=A0A645ISI6_9ZZZZ
MLPDALDRTMLICLYPGFLNLNTILLQLDGMMMEILDQLLNLLPVMSFPARRSLNLSQVFSVFRGRYAVPGTENPVERIEAGEPIVNSNTGDRTAGVFQIMDGMVQPQVIHVLDEARTKQPFDVLG